MGPLRESTLREAAAIRLSCSSSQRSPVAFVRSPSISPGSIFRLGGDSVEVVPGDIVLAALAVVLVASGSSRRPLVPARRPSR